MGSFLFAAAVVAFFALFAGVYAFEVSRWSKAVLAVSSELGLTCFSGGWLGRARATGVYRGLSVSIAVVTKRSGKSSYEEMQLSVRAPATFDGLELKRQGLRHVLAGALGHADVTIGSDALDGAVYITGVSRAVALSWLGREVRERALDAIGERGATLVAGLVRLETRRIASSVEGLRSSVRSLIALAEALSARPSELAARLADNVSNDSEGRIRAESLKALFDACPSSPEARDALEAALDDSNAGVRLAAARSAGAAGDRVLLEVAADGRADHAVRVEALGELGSRLLHDPALSSRAAVAERYLIERLEDDRPAVAAAAARALRTFAGLTAVEPLLARASGLFAGGEVSHAARSAAQAIQARHGGGGGRLSLVEGRQGELGSLSVAEPRVAGSLSLQNDDAAPRPPGDDRDGR